MWSGLKGALVGVASALAASVCCLLPLALVLLGLSSGAFMMVTMPYRWLLLPLSVLGLVAGYALYFRERRRCAAAACRLAGGRTALVLLVLATLVVLAELAFVLYPEPVARLLAGAPGPAGADASTSPTEHAGGNADHGRR
jgi:mercuric ion transport protein